jgi:hypothetical protein
MKVNSMRTQTTRTRTETFAMLPDLDALKISNSPMFTRGPSSNQGAVDAVSQTTTGSWSQAGAPTPLGAGVGYTAMSKNLSRNLGMMGTRHMSKSHSATASRGLHPRSRGHVSPPSWSAA